MKLFDLGPPTTPPKTEDGLTFRDAYYFKPANIVLAALGLNWDSAAVIARKIAEDEEVEAFANMFGKEGPPR